jgi:hypothetical protein
MKRGLFLWGKNINDNSVCEQTDEEHIRTEERMI